MTARHLIHIGYPKAGSTFLQSWFERHPALRYVPGGLGGFRSVYELARPSAGACEYYVTSCEELSSPDENAGGLPLDVGSQWMTEAGRIKKDQADVCAVLKSLYPGSRILIVTRGFKGMVMSGYSQYVRSGGTQHINRHLPESVRADAVRQVSNLFDFDYLIRLYAAAFGEESLIVLPYELLREDEGRFLAALEGELGLTHADIKLGRLNPSLSAEELYWYPLISRAVTAAASRLGRGRRRRVFGWYVGKTLDNRLRPLIKILSRLKPGRRITEDDFPVEILAHCGGNATLLRDRPLYAPYAAEYLWAEGGAGS